MSLEAIIQILLGIIGVLVLGVVGYYIGDINNKLTDMKTQIAKVNDELTQHLMDCKFQDQRRPRKVI